jgi:hypothetical protein
MPLIILCFCLVGCINKIDVNFKKNTGSSNNASGTATLESEALTRQANATITLTCASGTSHYIESASTPVAEDLGWTSCASNTYIANLAAGNNSLNFWFKTAKGKVSTSAQSLDIKQGSSFSILSSDSQAGGYFGFQDTIEITPTRFLITDSYNSHIANMAGAIQIYDNFGNLINTIYGNSAFEYFGGDTKGCIDTCEGTVKKLSQGRFAVHSPGYDLGATSNVGAIFVYDSNGFELFRVVGDDADDNYGLQEIEELPNGNFVVIRSNDDVSGIGANAGTVKLINGLTGAEINSFSGDNANDRLGSEGIILHSSGNFILTSSYDNITGPATNDGSVKFVSGSTGNVMFSIDGDNPNDYLGNGGITKLANGNFAIKSGSDEISGIGNNTGSVKVVNFLTGAIVYTITGNNSDDYFGGHVEELSNGNLVISSGSDDISGVNTSEGSVKIINGTTGAEIFSIDGDNTQDHLGNVGIYKLTNGNFYMVSNSDNVSTANSRDGSVRLINGITGAEIFSVSGDSANDQFGLDGIIILQNGNFLVHSSEDIVGGVPYVGSVKLFNGTDGTLINDIYGNNEESFLGLEGITILANGNFVIRSMYDSLSGVASSEGSVKLINGITGAEIVSINGDDPDDNIGKDGVLELSNGNIAIASSNDDVGGVVDIGSVTIINSVTGAIVTTYTGNFANDFFGSGGIKELSSNTLVVNSPNLQVTGASDTGIVTLYPQD